MTKDEAKRHLQAAKIMLLGKDGQPISDLYEAICVALDAIDAIEAAEQKIAELERILKAVQENSGINFRLWQEAEAQLPKEGEWIEVNKIKTYCSNCNWASYSMLVQKDAFLLRNNKTKYCPNCGARMKRKEADDGIHVRK